MDLGSLAGGRARWASDSRADHSHPHGECVYMRYGTVRLVRAGTPEGGREFCAALPFAPELLLLDPDLRLYRHLECWEGFKKLFFSPEVWEVSKAGHGEDPSPPRPLASTSLLSCVSVCYIPRPYECRDPTRVSRSTARGFGMTAWRAGSTRRPARPPQRHIWVPVYPAAAAS
jgi:hypothetical protein